MILTVKGADFSANSIGKVIDYSEAKELLVAHYPSHSDDDTAEALQFFWKALGKGTEGSIWDRLRWLILPIFGNSVTEDIYDAKNLAQGEADNPSSLVHSSRGIIFNSSATAGCSITNFPSSDSDLGSMFYVRTNGSDTSNYMGNAGAGGYMRPKSMPATPDILSLTPGGAGVDEISCTSGRLLMYYELGHEIGDTVRLASENGSSTYYLIGNYNFEHNKRIQRLCSHFNPAHLQGKDTTNPVQMVGSIKNMTDADATVLKAAVNTLLTTLNV